MLPTIVYPDAEAAALTYIGALLADSEWRDVQLGVRGGGGRFVRIRRVAGIDASPNHDRPVLDVIVWHDSDRSRMRLASQLWAWLRAANNDRAGDAVLCYSSTTLGPRQMPDPADDTKSVCMFTVELLARPA